MTPSPGRNYGMQEGGFMNVIVRIVVGAITGWLTGKLVEIEGRSKVVGEGHVLDIIYGIVGAIAGDYLFFWIVIGKGNGFSDFATAVLGSITVVGAARLLVARWRLARSYKKNTSPSSFEMRRVNPDPIDLIEAPAAP
jgi:uncharacterized membrane protein YeaQ/YmgE (transglycosylase-associated protein family)